MTAPLHVGIEHPNAVWLVVVAVAAFAAGAGVMLRSSPNDDEVGTTPAADEDGA